MASRFTKLVCTIHDDFWVLLFVEAFSTGMMLSIGSPVRTEAVIVKSKGLDQLTQTLNQQLLTTAAKSGASLDKEQCSSLQMIPRDWLRIWWPPVHYISHMFR